MNALKAPIFSIWGCRALKKFILRQSDEGEIIFVALKRTHRKPKLVITERTGAKRRAGRNKGGNKY